MRPRALSVVLLAGMAIPAVAHGVDRPTAEALHAQIRADRTVAAGWTGSSDTCTVGEEAPESLAATLRTVNAVRAFMGLEPVTFDSALNRTALAAALMMKARGALDHYPTGDWPCWSAAGADGAGKSNLHRGTATGSSAVLSYMRDAGVMEVGHRRWISRPTQRVMGSGSTGGFNALYVQAPRAQFPPASVTVTWPAAGWFPAEYVPPLWSYMTFPAQGAPVWYFRDARVSVTRDGVPLAVAGDWLGQSASHGAIGFAPDPAAIRDDGRDHVFAVRIDGVRDLASDAPVPPIEYTVSTLAGPGAPVPAPIAPGDSPATAEGLLGLSAARRGRTIVARVTSDAAGSVRLAFRATRAQRRARSFAVVRRVGVGTTTLRISAPGRMIAPRWRLVATATMDEPPSQRRATVRHLRGS